MSRLLNPDFKWTSAAATDVTATWKRHGFKPTTERERAARQKQSVQPVLPPSPRVVRFQRKER